MGRPPRKIEVLSAVEHPLSVVFFASQAEVFDFLYRNKIRIWIITFRVVAKDR